MKNKVYLNGVLRKIIVKSRGVHYRFNVDILTESFSMTGLIESFRYEDMECYHPITHPSLDGYIEV